MDGIEYIQSNKGGIKIIYKGYMYTVHKNKKCGGIRWRCAQRSFNCKGSISTTASGTTVINMPHNHLPDYQSVATARNKFEENLHEHLISNLLALETMADSMPLEQRLKATPEQEPVLQSQPLSPTKLKVTRQSTKPSQPSPKPPTPEPPNEEVCLRWNSHHSNMQTSFPSLLMKEQYVDATLVAEGRTLKCHRLILSSCSPYFEEVLSGISPFQHPVLFMKDIPFWVLKSLCDFMYAGEVHIFQNKLEELLAVAETLKIKGLAGKMEGPNEEVKSAETTKAVKEEKKEEKEVKEKKRNSQHVETPPKTTAKAVRSVYPTRKLEKINKESLNKERILDPLDLLEPVYEEVTKESVPPKLKEIKNIPMKKGKLKKRKVPEEREESPPPLFLSRKGTRSRPNVKIPKYYHTHYERIPDATIVREPHTDQADDPLMQVEEIKAEPLDLDDDVIEIEDNVIGFPDVPHIEEIIGNYDSPLVNLNNDTDKATGHTAFKKISLVAQPIIMNIHSVAEKSPSSLQIVDVGRLKETSSDKVDDPLATMCVIESDKTGEDPLNFEAASVDKGTSGITITNVQSIADLEEEEKREAESSEFHIKNIVSEKEDAKAVTVEKEGHGSGETVLDVAIGGSETETVKEKMSVIEDIPNVEQPGNDIMEEFGERDVEMNAEASIISNHENQMEQVPLAEPENIINEGQAETTEPEQNEPALGFHIAKVASEQFSLSGSVDSAVISENCAGELGFQISNVVSGQLDDPDVNMPDEAQINDLGAFSNHLSETEGEVNERGAGTAESSAAQVERNEMLSQETQILADSLEKLLDE